MILISEIDIESRFTPKIIIPDPLEPSATPNFFMSLLKPKITITTPLGTQPLIAAPWGDPGTSQWPAVQIAGGMLGLLYVWRLIKR
jgi:hypothetical protein